MLRAQILLDIDNINHHSSRRKRKRKAVRQSPRFLDPRIMSSQICNFQTYEQIILTPNQKLSITSVVENVLKRSILAPVLIRGGGYRIIALPHYGWSEEDIFTRNKKKGNRPQDRQHLIDLIETFPLTPISSLNTSYWEHYDRMLASLPVLWICNTWLSVRFPQHKPKIPTLSKTYGWFPKRRVDRQTMIFLKPWRLCSFTEIIDLVFIYIYIYILLDVSVVYRYLVFFWDLFCDYDRRCNAHE